LLDVQLIAHSVRKYVQQADPHVYLSNVLERTYPRGFDFEIFSRASLDEAFERATLPSDREHVTPYIHQNRSGQIRFQHITRCPDRSQYRLTVDTAEDFHLLKKLIEDYDAAALSTDELIDLLDRHPELVALNAHIEQKKI
jgi:spore coat polysaccharide biosynthesis protein SpsF